MNRLKLLLTGILPFAVVFSAVTVLDVLLQQGAKSQLEEYLSGSSFGVLNTVGVMLKWGLLLSAPAFLFGRHARWIYLPLWSWLVLVETVECIARIWYRMTLDGDWLMIVLASSATEVREFFGQFGVWTIAAIVVASLLVFISGALFFLRGRYPVPSRLSILLAVVFCAPFLLMNIVFANPLGFSNEVMYAFLPVDTVHHFATFRDIVRTSKKPRLPDCQAKASECAKETLGVFVIGESATRNHWHLYGYGRPTTPMMDGIRDELIVFRDVRALFPTTAKSLRMLLTEATRECPKETRSTFSQQCADAGYRCSLFSAHSRWGRWDGLETLLFSGCEKKCYLNELPDASPEVHDDRLLPLFSDAVGKSECSGQVLFLHLTGSHAPPILRYPLKRSIYPRYEGDVAPGLKNADSIAAVICDMYDNSIAFTDMILGNAIDRLKSLHVPCFLVYVSDHGETPRSGFWRDRSSADLFEVPFVVWFSSEYRSRFPKVVEAVNSLREEKIGMDRLLPLFRTMVHLE